MLHPVFLNPKNRNDLGIELKETVSWWSLLKYYGKLGTKLDMVEIQLWFDWIRTNWFLNEEIK